MSGDIYDNGGTFNSFLPIKPCGNCGAVMEGDEPGWMQATVDKLRAELAAMTQRAENAEREMAKRGNLLADIEEALGYPNSSLRDECWRIIDERNASRERAEAAEARVKDLERERDEARKIQYQYGQAAANMETRLCAANRCAEYAEARLAEIEAQAAAAREAVEGLACLNDANVSTWERLSPAYVLEECRKVIDGTTGRAFLAELTALRKVLEAAETIMELHEDEPNRPAVKRMSDAIEEAKKARAT